MSQQGIKEVLRAYSGSSEDRRDPLFLEALAAVEKDPELKKWWEQEQAWDQKVRRALAESPIPQELRGRLRSRGRGRRVSTGAWMALAASVVLFFSFFFRSSEPQGPVELVQFEAAALNFIQSPFFLSLKSPDPTEIRHWIAAKGVASDYTLPPKLQALEGIGCRVAKVNGISAAMICFKCEEKDREVHLMIVDLRHLQGAPPEGHPVFMAQGKWSTASWSDGRHGYLLAGDVPLEKIKGYF